MNMSYRPLVVHVALNKVAVGIASVPTKELHAKYGHDTRYGVIAVHEVRDGEMWFLIKAPDGTMHDIPAEDLILEVHEAVHTYEVTEYQFVAIEIDRITPRNLKARVNRVLDGKFNDGWRISPDAWVVIPVGKEESVVIIQLERTISRQ